jgi:hypothetical protein
MNIIDLDGIHQKLLDINGESRYFESEISVKLKPEDSTKTIICGVVSQEDLDNGTMNLEEITTGTYNIAIANGDVQQKYQNFFLYLKSTEPISGIAVTINTVEIAEPVEQPQPTTNNQTVFIVKIILTLIVLAIGISLMLKFLKDKSPK